MIFWFTSTNSTNICWFLNIHFIYHHVVYFKLATKLSLKPLMWPISWNKCRLRSPSRSDPCSIIWWLCRSGGCWRRLDGWTASCGSDREMNDSRVFSVFSIIQLIDTEDVIIVQLWHKIENREQFILEEGYKIKVRLHWNKAQICIQTAYVSVNRKLKGQFSQKVVFSDLCCYIYIYTYKMFQYCQSLDDPQHCHLQTD